MKNCRQGKASTKNPTCGIRLFKAGECVGSLCVPLLVADPIDPGRLTDRNTLPFFSHSAIVDRLRFERIFRIKGTRE